MVTNGPYSTDDERQNNQRLDVLFAPWRWQTRLCKEVVVTRHGHDRAESLQVPSRGPPRRLHPTPPRPCLNNAHNTRRRLFPVHLKSPDLPNACTNDYVVLTTSQPLCLAERDDLVAVPRFARPRVTLLSHRGVAGLVTLPPVADPCDNSDA